MWLFSMKMISGEIVWQSLWILYTAEMWDITPPNLEKNKK